MHFGTFHIPLPHFSVSGTLSANPPSVPHFSVSWYKQGGLFTDPSIIGVGESGPEAVLPLDMATRQIAEGVAKRGITKQDVLEAFLTALQSTTKKPVVLSVDGRELARAVANPLDVLLATA